MAFELLETSNFYGSPILLYEFLRVSGGANFYWRYNAIDVDVLDPDGNLYTATAISDDGVKQDGEATNSELNITMPVTEDFPAMFRTSGATPSDTVYVTVRRLHAGIISGYDNEARVMWVGTVSGMTQLDEVKVRITCATIVASFKRGGLRLSWTRGCPYALYDSQCKVNPEDFKTTTTIGSFTGNSITAAGLTALEDGYFDGGYLEWTTSTVLWRTGTDVGGIGSDGVVAMNPGDVMRPTDFVRSPSNEFALVFLENGNVILTQNEITTLWQTDTAESGADSFALQEDGNLVLYAGSTVLFATDTKGDIGDTLVLQDNGDLALYPLRPRRAGIVERRGIKSHVGDTVILLGSTFGLLPGQSLNFFPGCRRTRQVCNDKFNNILNFGGFPDTPGKSPFSGDPVF
jgi:hypothetical protein